MLKHDYIRKHNEVVRYLYLYIELPYYCGSSNAD